MKNKVWEMWEDKGFSVLPGIGCVALPSEEIGFDYFIAMLRGKQISTHPTLAQAQAAVEIAAAKEVK